MSDGGRLDGIGESAVGSTGLPGLPMGWGMPLSRPRTESGQPPPLESEQPPNLSMLPYEGETPVEYGRRMHDALAEWYEEMGHPGHHAPGFMQEREGNWPMEEPDRQPAEDLELMVRFPRSSSKHNGQFAAQFARRVQVIFGEDVVVMEPHVPMGRDEDDPEWFVVTPAEGM